MSEQTPQSRGGEARAEKLTAEQKREIARQGAKTRWDVDRTLPKATHAGKLVIGNSEIPCAVLPDGTRLLTQEGFLGALGRSTKPKGRSQQPSEDLPPFLATVSLSSLITDDIRAATVPIVFRTPTGGKALGYRAELLPKVCDLFLEARRLDLLTAQQQQIADKCEILVRALAQVGIVALVDEATGFQDERERDALHQLLSLYLSEEKLAWARRFPNEYYRQLYRLRGWGWPVGKAKTPLVGKLTNKIVYDRLPDGVLEELRKRNPTEPGTGRRKWKHHQFLSEDLGQPDLRDHLLQLVAIMRISKDWATFMVHFEDAFPKSGAQLSLLLEDADL
ncbi:P63C domain-containing protein [Mesorhizobium sp. M0029]|uniref:P63C domain-containing protein n=1 Tax=Mesorhizobium sp. M0029 TaxID=2956850 RepID=UPI00333B6168